MLHYPQITVAAVFPETAKVACVWVNLSRTVKINRLRLIDTVILSLVAQRGRLVDHHQ
jgi:hypothetical protein